MKKLLSVLLVLGVMTAAAEDSYLYWMVGDDAPAYTYAKITAYDGGVPLSILDATGATIGESVTATAVAEHKDLGFGLYAALGANPTYSSFVVELYNDSGFVAQSSLGSEAMAQYIVTANSLAAPSAMWTATSFAIPEPNSAMLLLIGCAALGLRRRRQRKV